jgi:HSP20 family molecular chaperone IbpA
MITTVSRSLISDLLDSVRYTALPASQQGTYSPRYNVRIDDETALYEIALPGYEKSEIEIRHSDDRLTISSTAKRTYDTSYVVASSHVTPFSLSWSVKNAKVASAKLENGMLRIVMQRSVSGDGDLVAIE